MSTRRSLVVVLVVALQGCALDGPEEPSVEAGVDTAELALGSRPVLAALGAAQWTVPPEIFGSAVGNVLAFSAVTYADGDVRGHIFYMQEFQGETFVFVARTTCVEVYDGNRAKYGGLITYSNDPTFTPGFYIWFQGIDNGSGPGATPDQSTISGFGDEAANAAFCASSAPPRRAFDVRGTIRVSD